jgi:ElaB/YqjD/DUF883 family membrane-anchored ribosome-binding protein
MRAHVEANKQIGDAVLRSVESFADVAAAQTRKATQNLTKNVQEHPIAWAAAGAAAATAIGILVARAVKH